MNNITLYTVNDFLKFEKIITAHIKTGGVIGTSALKEAKEFFDEALEVIKTKFKTADYKEAVLPKDFSFSMAHLKDICEIITDVSSYVATLKNSTASKGQTE